MTDGKPILNSLQNSSFSGKVFWEHKGKCHKKPPLYFQHAAVNCKFLWNEREILKVLKSYEDCLLSSYSSRINYIPYY